MQGKNCLIAVQVTLKHKRCQPAKVSQRLIAIERVIYFPVHVTLFIHVERCFLPFELLTAGPSILICQAD